MTSLSQVIDTMEQMHQWRNSFNGDQIGYGYDEYSKDKGLIYPEVYAKYAVGYLFLYKQTENDEYLRLCRDALQWLKNNTSPYYNDYCWGLPFDFDGVPANGPYLLTTSFCGHAFLDYYEYSNDTTYLNTAESAMNWIVDNLFMKIGGNDILCYSPYDGDRYFIPNAVSIGLGFLSRVSEYTHRDIDPVVKAVLQPLLSSQNSKYLWRYSTRSPTIDNLHNAYVLEGLWRYWLSYRDPSILKTITTGTDAHWKIFFEENGYGRGFLLGDLRDFKEVDLKTMIRDMIVQTANRFGFLMNKNPETRLWGYAASIRTFTYASYWDKKYLLYAVKAHEHVKTTLYNDLGYFYYRSTEKESYMRHQAHLFEALSVLGERMTSGSLNYD